MLFQKKKMKDLAIKDFSAICKKKKLNNTIIRNNTPMTWVVLAHTFIPALLTTFPDKITNLHTATIVVTFFVLLWQKTRQNQLSEAGFPLVHTEAGFPLAHTEVKIHHGSRTMNQREGPQLKVILSKFQTNQSMLVS